MHSYEFCRLLILYENCHLSLHASNPPYMWVVGSHGCIDMVGKLTGSGQRGLSDK